MLHTPVRTAPLPKWADNKDGRALIAVILDNPPHTRLHDACGFRVEQHSGKPAQMLRDLFDGQLAALGDAERAAWEAGQNYDAVHDQINALLCSERPDALITRLLASLVQHEIAA